MPELSDRVLARSEHQAIPALDRLKMKLKALTTPDELEHFNDSEVLAPGYARQQNEMAAHIGREKPYGRDQEAEIEYRDVELVEKYRKEQQAKKDAEQPQRLRHARQEYTDEFMKARRAFKRKEKADEKKRKKEEEAKQKTEPPENPSEAVSREQDRMKKIVEGLRPEAKSESDTPEDPQQAAMTKALKAQGLSGFDSQRKMVQDILDRAQKDGRPMSMEDAIRQMKGEPIADPSRPGEEQYQDILSKGAKARSERTAEEKLPEDPVYPQQVALRNALKAQGMEGMDSQIKMVQDILDKAKRSGRTISIEDAIREMRGEKTADPSLPGEEQYQKTLSEGAKAKQSRRDESEPEPDESDQVDPRVNAIQQALKAKGMEGMGSQVKMVQEILDKAKQGGITMSIEDAIRQMRGDPHKDPSLPKEGDYQDILKKGAQARQEMREKVPSKLPSEDNPEEPDGEKREKNYFEQQLDREDHDHEPISPKDRIANQQSYLEKIAQRYTVENLRHLVEETRTGETDNDYQARKREAIRLQSFLYSLNKEPRDYVSELEEVNSSLSPMSPDAKMSVLIPAYNEATRIERTLETWTTEQLNEDGTPIDPNAIEIIVMVNRPNETKQFDNTRDVIETFKKNHPEFAGSIQVVEKTFNFDIVTKKVGGQDREFPDVRMGTIYRYLTDLAIMRNTKRLLQGASEDRVAQHVMRTGGADVYKRSPYHVAHILKSFTDNEIEQYVSLSDYSPDVYEKIPLLFLAKQIQETMNEDLTQGLSHIGLGTYRAALYAEAGGFEQSMKVAEEMELSKRVRRVLKRRGGSLEGYRRRDLVLNALDDPRRDIATLYQGRAITRAYEDYQENQNIRSMDIAEIIAQDIPPQAELTPENLSTQADGIFKLYLDLYYDPENGMGEPQSTETTIHSFLSALQTLGIPSDRVHITYDGKPFDIKTYTDEVTGSAAPINEIRKKFHIDITSLPDDEQIHGLIEQQYEDVHGEWVFSKKDEDSEDEPPHEKKRSKVRSLWQKVTKGALARIGTKKKSESDLGDEARFPLPSPEMQKAALENSMKEYQQEFQAAQQNYKEPQIQSGESAVDAGSAEEDEEDEKDQAELDINQERVPQEDEVPVEEKDTPEPQEEGPIDENDVVETEDTGDADRVENDIQVPPSETHSEKTAPDYDRTVSQFIAANNMQLRDPERQRFILYLKSNNRTDIEQAYDDYLKENPPGPKAEKETPETSGNLIAEAALGMVALAEQGNPKKQSPQEETTGVTEDMKQTLQAGQRNNAEPWYREFVQDTEALKHMKKPGLFRSLSKEDMAHFDRIMTNSLDRLSDISTYESDASVLLKSASRNLEFAKAFCKSNSPARKLLSQKIEDFIQDDVDAMHYMHEYERAVNANALSLFSVTKRDTSFYKGLLAAFFRNKELHPTELANVLGIPEVRDILKQAVYGMEIHEAPQATV